MTKQSLKSNNSNLTKKGIIEKLFPFFIIVWLLSCTAVIGALSMGHVVALPTVEDSMVSKFKADLLRYQTAENSTEFVAHILADDCSCTLSLTRHLLKYGPRPDSEELILYVGNDKKFEDAALAAGFSFKAIEATDLLGMGLESAPILAVFDTEKNLKYVGGYYDHPAAVRPLDQKIRDSLQLTQAIEPLPIFGCATSKRLQEAFDPLGIVYKS